MSMDKQDDASPHMREATGLSVGNIAFSSEKDDASGEEEAEEEEIEEDMVEEEEIEEEEVTEYGERADSAYHIDNQPGSGDAFVAAGPYAQIDNSTTNHTVTNYYSIIQDSKRYSPDEKDADFKDIRELLTQTLAMARQNIIVPIQKTQPDDEGLPASHDAVSDWFYGLDEYEQCYVQAAALLHGTSTYEVSRRADELYVSQHSLQQSASSSNVNSTDTLSEEQKFALFTFHNRSRKDLLSNTYLVTQRVEGVERLYWCDVQSDGLSPFHLQFLNFLAGEYLSKGLHGEAFLHQLEAWAQESNKEYSLCAVRAYGVFLWHQSESELRSKATVWAKRPSATSWQRTAVFLDAAYEINDLKYPEHQQTLTTSPTLRLLAEWVEHAQKIEYMTDVYMGCTAAQTYALIGKRNVEAALSGMEQLLDISQEPAMDRGRLQAAVASAYFALSWSTDIYRVLSSLSIIAQHALLQRTRQKTIRSRHLYRLQYQQRLKVSLDAFFFIALDSVSSASTHLAATYQEALPAMLSYAERQKRDVVLAGILAFDSVYWRQEVIALVCVAIIEKSNQENAFDLLRRWTDTLIHLPDISSPPGYLLIASFQQFLIDLYHRLEDWCLDLRHQQRPSSAAQVYIHRLALWSQKKDAFGNVFQPIVHQTSNLKWIVTLDS